MIVNAITLHEPWASLMRAGEKRNETRSWGTRHLGPLLICAAKTKKGLTEETEWAIPFLRGPLLNFGHAVALVNLKRVVRTEHFKTPADWDNYPMNEKAFGDYSPGRFAWITEPIDLGFDPFPVKGRQGLFRIALDTEEGPDGMKVLGEYKAAEEGPS